jgi:hypothetical protein
MEDKANEYDEKEEANRQYYREYVQASRANVDSLPVFEPVPPIAAAREGVLAGVGDRVRSGAGPRADGVRGEPASRVTPWCLPPSRPAPPPKPDRPARPPQPVTPCIPRRRSPVRPARAAGRRVPSGGHAFVPAHPVWPR